jgi:hypothetical protein
LFRFGVLVSSIWVALFVIVAGTRVTEWWPIIGEAAQSNRLPLNSLGDTLSGWVAPLAFLWLFIATWLQSQELSLQRQELAETRKVLAAQMKELERSADESRDQTEIMQRTLEATRSREVYEDFRLRLYYLAKYVADRFDEQLFVTEIAENGAYSHSFHHLSLLQPGQKIEKVFESNNTSVDSLLLMLVEGIDAAVYWSGKLLSSQPSHIAVTDNFLSYVQFCTSSLSSLTKEPTFKSNALAFGRMEALRLIELSEKLNRVHINLINGTNLRDNMNMDVAR